MTLDHINDIAKNYFGTDPKKVIGIKRGGNFDADLKPIVIGIMKDSGYNATMIANYYKVNHATILYHLDRYNNREYDRLLNAKCTTIKGLSNADMVDPIGDSLIFLTHAKDMYVKSKRARHYLEIAENLIKFHLEINSKK